MMTKQVGTNGPNLGNVHFASLALITENIHKG